MPRQWSLPTPGHPDLAILLYKIEMNKLMLEGDDVLLRDVAFNEAEGEKTANKGKEAYDVAFVTIIAALGLTSSFALFVGYMLVTGVVSPLGRSTAVVSRLAAGDLQVEVEGTERGDELGILARALEVFKAALIDRKRVERETEQERIRSADAREKAEGQAISGERERVAKVIGNGVAKLAAKELAFRLTEELPDAYRQLRADFNNAIEQEFESAMQMVGGNAATINASTQEIAAASDNLSRRTEQQASTLEETAAALDQITATVRKTAEGAKHAREVVTVARTDADQSAEIVRRAVEAMRKIDKSSR